MTALTFLHQFCTFVSIFMLNFASVLAESSSIGPVLSSRENVISQRAGRIPYHLALHEQGTVLVVLQSGLLSDPVRRLCPQSHPHMVGDGTQCCSEAPGYSFCKASDCPNSIPCNEYDLSEQCPSYPSHNSIIQRDGQPLTFMQLLCGYSEFILLQ